MIQVGIRATRYPREHWESQLDVRQFWPEEQSDDEQLLQDVLAAVRATGLPMYLSNDIDGTDAEDADATGTPEAGGLSVSFVRELISQLPNYTRLVGADLVEVAPQLGRDGGSRTLEVAAEYVRVTLDGLLRSWK
jgi:agmatinase